jgi:uncharacterized protein (TIGR02328 family)
MRLWHQDLISKLPDKQLGGQWVEIRMILGTIAKHGKVNHSTVNYVNDHPIDYLLAYGYKVFEERYKRGMYSNPKFVSDYFDAYMHITNYYTKGLIYPEHDDAYLEECLLNLEGKGIFLREAVK